MKQILLVTFALLIQGPCIALPEDPAEYAAWEARQLAAIEEQKTLPPEQAIPNLGKWVHKLSLHTHLEKGDRVVYNTARDLLLSIPGHAEWYGEQIKKMTDNDVNRTGLTFKGRRHWHFQTLSQLPSPETVRVLGEQLFDERNPFAGILTDAPWVPSCYTAVIALHNLGLENPPVKTAYPVALDDLRSWQLWYEQVRAGTRTFSFKGDETIYSLSGPVNKALDPGEIPSAAPRPPASEPGETSSEAGPGSSKIPLIVALSLALLALVLAARRAKLNRSA